MRRQVTIRMLQNLLSKYGAGYVLATDTAIDDTGMPTKNNVTVQSQLERNVRHLEFDTLRLETIKKILDEEHTVEDRGDTGDRVHTS